MIARLLGDNPGLKMTTFETKCPAHTSKIALVVDPDEDYHFYRQDNNGLWSHKDGWKLATNKDAKGKLIKSPETANRGYYNLFCGYYAVPNLDKLKNMSNITKPYKNKISETQKVLRLKFHLRCAETHDR
jgi:hypothetical protein